MVHSQPKCNLKPYMMKVAEMSYPRRITPPLVVSCAALGKGSSTGCHEQNERLGYYGTTGQGQSLVFSGLGKLDITSAGVFVTCGGLFHEEVVSRLDVHLVVGGVALLLLDNFARTNQCFQLLRSLPRKYCGAS
jgi:hypothetical protein